MKRLKVSDKNSVAEFSLKKFEQLDIDKIRDQFKRVNDHYKKVSAVDTEKLKRSFTK